MSAAWAAYFAQYSTLFNQAGAQTNTAGIPYAGQTGLLGSAVASATNNPQVPTLDQQPQAPTVDANQGTQAQQDYSDQWIEYYIANGRPDYAEQIIQMKKQQQAQKQHQPQSQTTQQ